ncbi:hypothetical protein WICPIJ_000102 [Wickerhamomyces pijperi]|uniref:Uncharacterized protein n=1 Tax=Wickerhamomyces pijperi TaxID=599730 RepID=A0A9P8QI44_WICPI|nr:hypothetical protein WICPIJ_000102 [Wickerhamomyces pijperi]
MVRNEIQLEISPVGSFDWRSFDLFPIWLERLVDLSLALQFHPQLEDLDLACNRMDGSEQIQLPQVVVVD